MNLIRNVVGRICKYWFYKKKWKVINKLPSNIKKAVVVCGPHTSNWDGVFANAVMFKQKINFFFAIKKELTFFPLGYFFKKFGAIPIDRKKKNSAVEQISDIFNTNDECIFLISPEGTRKYNDQWKTGFYYIAKNANVPIILAFLDYEKREAGWGPIVTTELPPEETILQIKKFYRNIPGKIPENGVL